MSGKFYYELVAEAGARNARARFAFIRIEELCPFPFEGLEKVIKARDMHTSRSKCCSFIHVGWIWAQEEPQNQGAFSFVAPRIERLLGKPLEYVGRDVAACPATGISFQHKHELRSVMDGLFSLK